VRELRVGYPTTTKTGGLVAVIDIGSTAIRMVVAEIGHDGDFRVLDKADRPIGLGRDVFQSGSVSRELMSESLAILRRFREMLAGWQIGGDRVRVIATSALREARNRDTFIDRVEIRTGLQVNIIEGIEANRLTYVAVREALAEMRQEMSRSNSLIIEVGGGSTELMLLQRGKMVAAHTSNLGTVRLEPQLRSAVGSAEQMMRILKEGIRTTREFLDSELKLQKVRHFIAVGGDARLAAERVGTPAGEQFSIIENEQFSGFVHDLATLSVDECVRRLHIPYSDAESLVPALLIYLLLARETSADRIIVPAVSIREGMLLTLARGPDDDLQKEFRSQVLASAVSLGRKYHFDEKHGRHVARLALSLFDQLEADHGLDAFYRLLLHVAAVLHDIGTYVATTGHHKHGQYLVSNSEIFGLDADDLAIVSYVVRYHRRALPSNAHMTFMALPRDRRLVVMKLAALLRVADALDRGHSQRVKSFVAERKDDELILHCEGQGDIAAERFGMAQKADMFEQVFGMRVVIL
jgi:exopolyphosphatase/guanosine-5'-triphosphate,3'-diphosphate pyrophosphatase